MGEGLTVGRVSMSSGFTDGQRIDGIETRLLRAENVALDMERRLRAVEGQLSATLVTLKLAEEGR